MTADHLTDCPQCKGALKRIIGTGAGPIFKGSGFYQTDYKNTKRSEVKNSKPATVSKKTRGEEKTK
jgi:predicted nucleic acid-binding Zn ribbon protein